jgi:formylglycine-generating enzyme required for sulfatase activity
MRGRYVEDGGFYTVNAYSYAPNGYGLYNMSGNVAEWCNTAYDESGYDFSHDLNPEYTYDALDHDPISMKRKVIRGVSWKDIGYFIQTGTWPNAQGHRSLVRKWYIKALRSDLPDRVPYPYWLWNTNHRDIAH